MATDIPRPTPESLARTTYAFQRTQWKQSPTNAAEAWKFGRAAFDWSEFATNRSTKSAIADQGVQACRSAVAIDSSAPAHYYLALNLGRVAETRGLSALDLLREMAKELETARGIDPSFDHAGADRSLGLLYRDAPGWPVSLGNWTKARQYLEGAVQLDGDYPENRIALAELYAEIHEKRLLAVELKALDAIWESSRSRLAGLEWERTWEDWTARRQKLMVLVHPKD